MESQSPSSTLQSHPAARNSSAYEKINLNKVTYGISYSPFQAIFLSDIYVKSLGRLHSFSVPQQFHLLGHVAWVSIPDLEDSFGFSRQRPWCMLLQTLRRN
jgi:hypothetical protein